MDRDEIRNTLIELLAVVDDERDWSKEEINEETLLRDGLGLDSLQLTEFLFEVEEKFNTRITDEEARELRNAGDLITLIENKLKPG